MKFSFKNRFLVSLFTSAMGTTFLLPSTYAMDPPQIEKPESPSFPKTQRKFSTIDEGIHYAENLYNLSLEKKFEVVLKLEEESKEWVLPCLISEIEVAFYNFYYCYAFSESHRNIGDTCLNSLDALKHYRKSIDYVKKYLENPTCGDLYVDPNEDCNVVLNEHRSIMQDQGARSNFCWASLLMKPDDSEDVLISITEEALSPKNCNGRLRKEVTQDLSLKNSCIKRLLLSAVIGSSKAVEHAEKANSTFLNKFKKSLISQHLNFNPYSNPKEKIALKKDIRLILFQLKSTNDPDYEKLESQVSTCLSQTQELDVALAKKTNSRNISKIQQQNIKQKEAELARLVEKMNGENISLKVKIFQQHQEFILSARVNPQNSTLIPLIKKIEEDIQSELTQSTVPSDLSNVYEKYQALLGGDLFLNQISSYIVPAFLYAGNVVDALERICILGELEQKKWKTTSLMTRFLRAAIKNLNGDHEEWEAIEKEIISFAQKEKEKKQLAKAKKLERKVSEIKQAQEIAASLQIESKKTKTPTKPQKSLIGTADEQPEEFLAPVLSIHDEKEEKKQRHEAAEKQRELNAKIPQIVNITPDVPVAPLLVIQAQPDKKIRDLYILTKVAKTVDEEIENNTWKFTRENLMTYFESLDCIATDGGKHKKVALPKAVIISYQGTPITIMNDLGGALTLPRWDGSTGNGQVPDYLRQQILKAREKLVLLKLKALAITRETQ